MGPTVSGGGGGKNTFFMCILYHFQMLPRHDLVQGSFILLDLFLGSVFPSGCHRHPERFPRAGNLDSICSDLASLKTGESETQSSRSSLSGECSECRTICHCRLSSSTRTLSNDSGLMKERSETSDIVSEDSDSVYRTKSCDRIGSRSGFKQKFISEKPNKRKPVMSHLSNLSLLSGGVKLAGLVGSGTKILRRHTTYIRNPGAGAEEVKVNSGHIHTWNRQVNIISIKV